MRRKDREITDFGEIIKIIEKCDVCRLALNTGEYPYILPLNFGMQIENEKIILYFHGATKGQKYDFIAKDNRASFEMDCSHYLILDEQKGNCTMEYESVVGQGVIEMIAEEEKYEALHILMQHYHKEEFSFSKDMMPSTTVFKLVVEQVTGKVLKKRK